jgi:phosphohistidine phosphatase SixA
MLRLVAPLIALSGALIPTPAAPELRGEELFKALHGGGYTIVLRHARTDRSFREEMGSVPALRSQQRNLDDNGVRDARLMGAAFRRFAIPFGEIVSSPMFRATETAEYAVGVPTRTTMALRTFPSPVEARELIAAAPRAGTNTLIVTHHFVIEAHVPGIRPGEIGESEAVVVRRTADGAIEVVGRITLADWQALGADAGAARATHPVTLPGSTLGRLAQGYLRAFNSGDSTTMRAFVESSLRADVSRPLAERIGTYVRLFGDFGPLTPTALEAASEQEIVVAVAAKTGDLRLTFRLAEGGRLGSVTFATEQPGRHP